MGRRACSASSDFCFTKEARRKQALQPPMPPNLFTVHKLTDKLSIIAPYGPDMSQVGGNIGVFMTDEGVLVVDDNYYTAGTQRADGRAGRGRASPRSRR